MTQPTVSQQDLLLIIGQQTVELAYLRARLAELEREQQSESEPAKNGPGTRAELAEMK